MGELAELGRIAKAQQQQQPDSHLGRNMALGGLGSAAVGGAVAGSGIRANLKDQSNLHVSDGNVFRSGRDGTFRRVKPMQQAGAKRMAGGGAAVLGGKAALGAAPVVGLTNMYNKRRNKKFQAQQPPV